MHEVLAYDRYLEVVWLYKSPLAGYHVEVLLGVCTIVCAICSDMLATVIIAPCLEAFHIQDPPDTLLELETIALAPASSTAPWPMQ
jgi:hypothetical protein